MAQSSKGMLQVLEDAREIAIILLTFIRGIEETSRSSSYKCESAEWIRVYHIKYSMEFGNKVSPLPKENKVEGGLYLRKI